MQIMETSQLWTILAAVIAMGGITIGVTIALFLHLDSKIEAQGNRLSQLAEWIAEMKGELDVVVHQAHTHETVPL